MKSIFSLSCISNKSIFRETFSTSRAAAAGFRGIFWTAYFFTGDSFLKRGEEF